VTRLDRCSAFVHIATMETMTPGQILARGTCRHLVSRDFQSLEEFTPERGMRVDVMAVGSKGELWIVECKSSRADYMSDTKWTGYLPYCDRFFWAVDADFPVDILPADTGLIIADGYGADILRMGPETPLPPARRKKLTLRFARNTAQRLHLLRDPLAATFC
jgi:hypothetical protein